MTTRARKSGASILVADGHGGMRQVADHRFASRSWPIERALADAEAASWMTHMKAESEERNWPSHGLGQLHADENSGSLTIFMGQPPDAPTVEITWEKPRRGRLLVRARASDSAHSVDAQAFVDSVDARHRERRLLREHRRTWITYHGLPWEGNSGSRPTFDSGRHRAGRPR